MVHKERIGRSHTRGFRGKFARLQTKPSLASYYCTHRVYILGRGKDSYTSQDTGKHNRNGSSECVITDKGGWDETRTKAVQGEHMRRSR